MYVHVVPVPPVVTVGGTAGHDMVVIGPALISSIVEGTELWYGCVVDDTISAWVAKTIVFDTASGPFGSIAPPGGDVNTKILLTVDIADSVSQYITRKNNAFAIYFFCEVGTFRIVTEMRVLRFTRLSFTTSCFFASWSHLLRASRDSILIARHLSSDTVIFVADEW